MEKIYELKKPESIKSRKRVGRGPGSGMGKTSTRGQKGQMSRAGSKHRAWFEGGQMPLQRRIPKRGFNNYTKKDIQIVNLSKIANLDLSEITPMILKEMGYIEYENGLVKILGNGELNKNVKIVADSFSKTAEEKIKKAGGEIILRKIQEKK